jgi:hypothetical protein
MEEALDIAFEYGGTDGAHHKQWVIDQMVRAISGEGYAEWVSLYEGDGQYEWDTGIAP